MSSDMPPDLPEGKYNKWCERRPLVCAREERISRAQGYALDHSLTSSEIAAFYVHELVGCEGLEFVVFSNAYIKQPVVLPGRIIIVPCFSTDLETGDKQLAQLTLRMTERACFVYDGWLPMVDWQKENVGKAVRIIHSALSIFAVRASAWFSWEPKYSPFAQDDISHNFEQEHVMQVSQLTQFVNQMEEPDAQALLSSIGWLSHSLRVAEPAAKFLFGILAIESLASYIEESSDGSAFNRLRSVQLTKERRAKQRQACIRDVMAQILDTDPEKAIRTAYFDCLIGIKQLLQSHLENVFREDKVPIDLLFKIKVDGKTLYDLRNDLAHGRVDALSEAQREAISVRAWDVECTAREYILKVIEILTGREVAECPILESVSFRMRDAIVPKESMYRGPTHMAEVYSLAYRDSITLGH